MQHHANLLIGTRDWGIKHIPREYQKKNTSTRFFDYDSMTIGHARELIREANLKAADGGQHVFVLSAKNILREAQNALLKLFEDPNPDTIFYLILQNEETLLLTLRSRLHVLHTENAVPEKKDFGEFLSLGPADRLKIIEKKIKEEDTVWVKNIATGVEVHAHKTEDSEIIKNALMLSRYIETKGASKKMLLEHVALSL